LVELLFGSVPSADDDEARREAAAKIDAYAHGLAEKIRGMRDACKYDPDSAEHRHMSGSADLIDPEVAK